MLEGGEGIRLFLLQAHSSLDSRELFCVTISAEADRVVHVRGVDAVAFVVVEGLDHALGLWEVLQAAGRCHQEAIVDGAGT